MRTRRLIVRAAILAIFALLVARLWQIQVVHGREYRRASEQNRIRLIRREAARGTIYDRRGRILATSRPCLDVVVTPEEFGDDPEAVAQLARILHAGPAEIAAKLTDRDGPFEAVTVAGDVPFSIATRAAEEGIHVKGMRLECRPVRYYPRGPFAAHVLGYVREISARELQQARDSDSGYTARDRIGKDGVERVCEASLRGADGGEQIEVDAAGKLVQVLGEVAAVAGDAVTLSLDVDVQRVAEGGLAGKRGAAVAMDARSGEILALASSPTFDPNTLSGKVSRAQWRHLSGPSWPQQNRALAALYEPGSIFKLVTAAAGIESGHAASSSLFFCPGYWQLGKWRFHCWQRGGHGSLDLVSGIAQSCNVTFIKLGRSVGRPGLERWAKAFGLGAETGIDLPGENSGLVPNPQWKHERFDEAWYPGDTCQMAVGQGGLLITPLQAAVVTAAIANGGYLVTPHVVRAVGDVPVGTNRPRPVGIDPATAAVLRRGMAAVVGRGTARRIRDRSFPIAGKTGTAENPHGQPHAWFVGFAPVEEPQVVVAVLVEQGGSGTAMAPIGAAMLRAALKGDESERASVARLP
ncbi:MAG: penicillin-binding protein 2 [Armatimonadota bacterium]|nr:MAG: penicillin-binding protein 2 [Armatimonadota bacterium]